jgi:hypothetical protein
LIFAKKIVKWWFFEALTQWWFFVINSKGIARLWRR